MKLADALLECLDPGDEVMVTDDMTVLGYLLHYEEGLRVLVVSGWPKAVPVESAVEAIQLLGFSPDTLSETIAVSQLV